MKVKILQPMAGVGPDGKGFYRDADSILDFPDALARELVASGQALEMKRGRLTETTEVRAGGETT